MKSTTFKIIFVTSLLTMFAVNPTFVRSEESQRKRMPDLKFVELEVEPLPDYNEDGIAVFKVGKTYRFSVFAKNIGPEKAGSCEVLFDFETEYYYETFPSLKPGKIGVTRLDWTPTSAGIFRFGFEVDTEDVVQELNENNNDMLSGEVWVQATAD